MVGLDADETRPQTILSGDRNVTGGGGGGERHWQNASFPNSPPATMASDAGFDVGVHKNAGNLGLGDGSVQQIGSGTQFQKQIQAAMNSGSSDVWFHLPQ
jgi:hypothetical protein